MADIFILLSWLTRTDPKDVARVESRTFISTRKQIDSVPTPKHGIYNALGNNEIYFFYYVNSISNKEIIIVLI